MENLESNFQKKRGLKLYIGCHLHREIYRRNICINNKEAFVLFASLSRRKVKINLDALNVNKMEGRGRRRALLRKIKRDVVTFYLAFYL